MAPAIYGPFVCALLEPEGEIALGLPGALSKSFKIAATGKA